MEAQLEANLSSRISSQEGASKRHASCNSLRVAFAGLLGFANGQRGHHHILTPRDRECQRRWSQKARTRPTHTHTIVTIVSRVPNIWPDIKLEDHQASSDCVLTKTHTCSVCLGNPYLSHTHTHTRDTVYSIA